jgi:hypothetical protein
MPYFKPIPVTAESDRRFACGRTWTVVRRCTRTLSVLYKGLCSLCQPWLHATKVNRNLICELITHHPIIMIITTVKLPDDRFANAGLFNFPNDLGLIHISSLVLIAGKMHVGQTHQSLTQRRRQSCRTRRRRWRLSQRRAGTSRYLWRQVLRRLRSNAP